MQVRIEDLVSGQQECFEELARFVHSTISPEAVVALAQHTKKYAKGYFGGHYTEAQSLNIYQTETKQDKVFRQALDFWGYQIDSFGVSKTDCTKLKWRKEWKERVRK
jgi:hypothetical protein